MTTHDRILEMLEAGHSYREIRAECNVSDTTIWRVSRGLTTGRVGAPSRPRFTERDAEIVRLVVKERRKPAEVAERYGISRQRVEQIVQRASANLDVARGQQAHHFNDRASPRADSRTAIDQAEVR